VGQLKGHYRVKKPVYNIADVYDCMAEYYILIEFVSNTGSTDKKYLSGRFQKMSESVAQSTFYQLVRMVHNDLEGGEEMSAVVGHVGVLIKCNHYSCCNLKVQHLQTQLVGMLQRNLLWKLQIMPKKHVGWPILQCCLGLHTTKCWPGYMQNRILCPGPSSSSSQCSELRTMILFTLPHWRRHLASLLSVPLCPAKTS
jgi:hypothetical protein